MPLMTPAIRHGYRIATPVASITAANTPVTLFALPADGQTGVIRKLLIWSGQSGPTTVSIGDNSGPSGAFVKRLCDVNVAASSNLTLAEDVLPNWEFGAGTTILVLASAAGAAPNDVRVQAEIELFVGSTPHG